MSQGYAEYLNMTHEAGQYQYRNHHHPGHYGHPEEMGPYGFDPNYVPHVGMHAGPEQSEFIEKLNPNITSLSMQLR